MTDSPPSPSRPVTTLKGMASGRSDVFALDPRLIVRDDDWNVRLPGAELDEHIAWLKDSIRARGFLSQKPLVVYMEGGRPHLTDGYCRHAAVLALIAEGVEIKSIPVVAESRHSNDADRVVGLITHNSGKPLAPLEQGTVFKRLLGFGWKESQIAKDCGYSVTHVSNMLRLAAAPEATKQLVREKVASATAVVTALRSSGGDATEAGKIVNDAIERHGKATVERVSGRSVRPRPDAVYAEILALCDAEAPYDEIRAVVLAAQGKMASVAA